MASHASDKDHRGSAKIQRSLDGIGIILYLARADLARYLPLRGPLGAYPYPQSNFLHVGSQQ